METTNRQNVRQARLVELATTRRSLLRNVAIGGLGAVSMGRGVGHRCAAAGEPLVIPTDSWIRDEDPSIAEIDLEFQPTIVVSADAIFDFDVMLADVAAEKSTWDAYLGPTPFLDLLPFIDSGAIEPWDSYLPAGFLEDLPPAIRAEGTYQDKLYMFPVLLDVVVQNWNGALLEKAGFDPAQPPQDWDTFIATATAIQSKRVATYGCSFDVTPWRSLIPIALSLNSDIFNEDGTVAWANDSVVDALEILRRITELSQPGAGAADTFMNPGPFFALEQAASLVTYGAAAVLQTPTWEDPHKLTMASLPTTSEQGGGSVFWNTGAVLFKYGAHKAEAAAYLHAITTDQRVWQHELAGTVGVAGSAVGHMPFSTAIWTDYAANPPVWLVDSPWAFPAWDAVQTASFIHPSKLGFDQFVTALPLYAPYLTGEEKDAKVVLQRAQDAVAAALKAKP